MVWTRYSKSPPCSRGVSTVGKNLPSLPKMLLTGFRRLAISPRPLSLLIKPQSLQQTRYATKFAPTHVRHTRVHKGRAPIPTGGSIKGTTLNFGDYGIRVRGEGMRITAKQLQAAETAMKRRLKVVKGVKIHMRVFPDMPVCVKVGYFLFTPILYLTPCDIGK